MRRGSRARGAWRVWFAAVLGQEALVLVFVTVGAQQLPVAPIGRVVVVVVVPMMNFQELQVGVGELATTAPAYPRINLECPLAVALARSSLARRASATTRSRRALSGPVFGPGISAFPAVGLCSPYQKREPQGVPRAAGHRGRDGGDAPRTHPHPSPPLEGREQTAASPGRTGKSEGPTEEVVLVANEIGADASGRDPCACVPPRRTTAAKSHRTVRGEGAHSACD